MECRMAGGTDHRATAAITQSKEPELFFKEFQ